MRRLPVSIFLLVAAALALSACSFVTPTAYLSVNRSPAPMADGLALPATAGSGSAATAAAAKPIAVDTTKTLELTASSSVTLDLTGSWLAWTPLRYNEQPSGSWSPAPVRPEWACPSGTYAYFHTTNFMIIPELNDLFEQLVGPLQALSLQSSNWLKRFTYGSQCVTAYNGKTMTIATPDVPPAAAATYLYITTTSSMLQPVLFQGLNGVTTEFPGSGLPIQGTSWVKVKLKAAEPATPPTPPTARVVARASPVWVAGGAFTDSRTLWYEVDARQSTDASGGALSYSWDLDGDGVYGDASGMPDPPGASLPTGVAIVPVTTLDVAAGDGKDITVGVKVTNATGQVSAAATTTIRPLPNQDYADNYRSAFTLDTSTPTVGGTVTLTLETPMSTGGYGCVDADGDGVYETTASLPMRSGPALSTVTATTTALAAGPHLVTVVFIRRYGGASCANPTADTEALTFRQVYTSVAARSGAARDAARASGYSAATTMRLSNGKTLRASSKAPQTMRLDGTVFGGRYRWLTPRRGNGSVRPGALGAFTTGAYVAQAGKLAVVGGAAHEVGVGSGTMLLRGAGANDLLCLAVTSPGPVQNTLLLGGTGAGANLRGSLSGASLMMPFDAIGLVGVTGAGKNLRPEFGQIKPFSNTATLTASNGTARKLPKACRALVAYLPARNGGGSSTPSVVTG